MEESLEESKTRKVKELQVIEYLNKNGIEHLKKEKLITATRHKRFPNLIQLTYSKIKADFSDPVVQECRGLIVDEKNNFTVISFPFEKFFNLHEDESAKLVFDQNTKVYEKYDGSLATLYFYNGDWQVSSFSRPDGLSKLKEGLVFETLFWNIFKRLSYKKPADKGKCYMFEMLSKKNVVVIKPKEEVLILIGVKDVRSYKEFDPLPFAKENGWKSASELSGFSNLQEVIDAANSLTGGDKEGFVVCDSEFRRVKVKSPVYVAISHLRENDPYNKNPKQMLRVVKANESSEFLCYFPQWKELYVQVKERYDKLIIKLKNGFIKLRKKCTSPQNEFDKDKFADLASKTKFRELLFTLLEQFDENPLSLELYLKDATLDEVWELLESLVPNKK